MSGTFLMTASEFFETSTCPGCHSNNAFKAHILEVREGASMVEQRECDIWLDKLRGRHCVHCKESK